MQLKSIVKGIAAIGIAAAFATPALATDSFKVTGFTHGSQAVTIKDTNPSTGGAHTYGAGEVSVTWNGKTFDAFCGDIYQTISFGTVYTNEYTYMTTTARYGATAAADLGRLWSAWNADQNASSTKTAAFQLAVWEIVNENTNPVPGFAYDLGTGEFTATSGAAGVISQAQFYLNNLGSGTAQLGVAASRYHQDFLVPVPEPETYAMMLAGLGLMGVVARRRTRVAA